MGVCNAGSMQRPMRISVCALRRPPHALFGGCSCMVQHEAAMPLHVDRGR